MYFQVPVELTNHFFQRKMTEILKKKSFENWISKEYVALREPVAIKSMVF